MRDDDVLLEHLSERAALLPEPDRPGAAVLLDRLGTDRARDRDALSAAMNSERYARLLDRLVDAARDLPVIEPHTTRPRRLALRLAQLPWKRLRHTIRALPAEPSDAELHEVRKRAKHARYALEAITPLSPPRVGRLAARISVVQDVLGAHHDAVVAAVWLRTAAADLGDPRAAFAAVALADGLLRDADAHRADWRRRWRRAHRLGRDVL